MQASSSVKFDSEIMMLFLCFINVDDIGIN